MTVHNMIPYCVVCKTTMKVIFSFTIYSYYYSLRIPSTHEVTMQHGSRAVLALAADPSGARLGKNVKFL